MDGRRLQVTLKSGKERLRIIGNSFDVRHRDKMSDMTRELRISVRLSADLHERIEAAAAKSGKRESVIIREALERQLAPARSAETAYDLAVRAGIVGIARGNPPDLSTNPRHFDGFGES